MAEYGEYSSADSILAIYDNGKLNHIFTGVIAETIFLHQDYHNDGKHMLDFKMKSSEETNSDVYYISPNNSFCVFPSWMEKKLEKEIKENKPDYERSLT